MNVKYFKDTDTALLEFSASSFEQTREISESIYIDLDADGNLVSMTIEHAAQNANLPSVVVEQFGEFGSERQRVHRLKSQSDRTMSGTYSTQSEKLAR